MPMLLRMVSIFLFRPRNDIDGMLQVRLLVNVINAYFDISFL